MCGVTYPLETEAAVRRRMLNMCQDHARIVVDIVRELTLLMESVSNRNGEEADKHSLEMGKLISESKQAKSKLLEEIASVGSLLISRESFLRLIFEVEKISDYAEAVAYRLMDLEKQKWKVNEKYMAELVEFMTMVLEQIIKVRETMMSLGFNPEKALELSKNVEQMEKSLDEKNRSLDMKILKSNLPIPAMLLMREILNHVEMISDIGMNVIDLIRLIAIYG
ncbi:MAG: DUF47 family protein [Candidatus Bathyarchaeia archaeon]